MRAPALFLALALGLAAPVAGAQPATSATVAPGAQPPPLPELPKLAPITHPAADPVATKELAALLERLTAEDERTRKSARPAVASVEPSALAPIRVRIQELRGSLDREAAPLLLEDLRKEGRKSLKKAAKDPKAEDPAAQRPKKNAEDDEGDWLDFALARPKPKDSTWRDLVHLLAMERMLAAIGTTPAVRELVQLHAYFGELLRVDLQRQIARLKDKAVPALIEARQHDAKIVQRWASRQLDLLGKAIPGEAVATSDTQVLADVLRAYGRTRDVDAVRVLLSFCNSDRIQLREAAREAIAAVGEPGSWQLKDVYLGLTGNKPPRDWAWDRLARELFALYDRARLAEVHRLMDEGIAAAGAGKHEAATAAFDKVLARAPLFDRRKEMVPSYVARAKELDEAGQREQALEMLRKALRLDPEAQGAKLVAAEAAYLEGMVLVARGTPDKFIFNRALELDPSHTRARAALASLEDKAIVRQSSMRRYAAAAAIGVAALIAMTLLLRTRRRGRGDGAAPPPPAPPQREPDSDPSTKPAGSTS